MKTTRTYLFAALLISGICSLLLSCGNWDLPTRKSQRNCEPPTGTIKAQIQQRKVDFSIPDVKGTIDQVQWNFGDGSTPVTSGTAVSYTYPKNGTYPVKATLTNTCGNVLTISAVITVSDAVVPSVALQAITTSSSSSAMAGMTVTSDGNATITTYGICYSTTQQVPSVGQTGVSTAPVTGVPKLNETIPMSLTGLQPNTTYYARSYAINSAGTGYSDPVIKFTTAQLPVITNNGSPTVAITTATVTFIVNNPGNPAAVEYGICYSADNTTPDVQTSTVSKVTSPPIGVNVSVNLSDLTSNKTYYYRPYAKTASGEIVYGAIMTFTTQIDTVTQDLIASVSFTDKSLLDVSGYNNHVKLVGSPTFTTDHTGKANSAVVLNGSGDYFYMPDNSSLSPDELTISIWIKPAKAPTGVDDRMQIYNKARFSDGLPQTYSSLIKLEGDKGPALTFMTDIKQGSNCVGGDGWQSVAFTSSFQLNAWHHLVFTYSGRTAKMYFDNALLSSRSDLPGVKIDYCPGGELKFGAQYQSLPWYFSGAMDDIRIYKRAITAAEVEKLFKQ